MTNCEVINALGTVEVESQVYGVLSIASSIAAHVKDRAYTVRYAFWLHKIDRSLRTFLDNVHSILEGRKPAPKGPVEPVTKERASNVVDNLEHTYRVIDYIYESARRARMTNNSMTAGSLASLKKLNEEFLDLADWFELVMNPEQFNSKFERAEREKEAGEVYDLEQVI